MHTLRWSMWAILFATAIVAYGDAEDAKAASAAVAPVAGAAASVGWRGQHFVCDAGYSKGRCHEQMARLVGLLYRFQKEIPADWTWVLVRQDDWRAVITQVGLDPHTPAFSTLSRRETFLDESLFAPNAANAADLLATFATPLNQMLELAVSHELGHALCMDRRELEATRFSETLRTTGVAHCSSVSPSSSLDTMITLPVPR